MRLNLHASWPVLLSTAFAAVLLSAQTASAQLTLCNKSSETSPWRSPIATAASSCHVAGTSPSPVSVQPSSEDRSDNRYYYVRAEGSQGTRWDGDYAFCVADTRFTLNGEHCGGGLDRRKFFMIDTGLSSSWTQNLTMGPSSDFEQREHAAIAGLRITWRPSLLEDGLVRHATAQQLRDRRRCHASVLHARRALEDALDPGGRLRHVRSWIPAGMGRQLRGRRVVRGVSWPRVRVAHLRAEIASDGHQIPR